MSQIPYLCRITTLWTDSGEFDEEAYRQYLQRFIDSNIGVLMASPGFEGRSLTPEELLRVYQVGVEYCQGKIPIGASGIEENTAAATIARARAGCEAGLDFVNVYGPAGFHGYTPTNAEYLAFYDNVLAEIKCPVAIGPNAVLGYLISPAMVAEVCNKHPQVVSAVLTGVPDEMYFLELKSLLKRDVEIYVGWHGSLETLKAGATGLAGNGAAILSKTMRRYLDLYQAEKFEEAAIEYYNLRRYEDYQGLGASHVRSLKMALKAFKLPGGNGVMREPFLMPDDAAVEKYLEGALALNIPELNEIARAAGIRVSAGAA